MGIKLANFATALLATPPSGIGGLSFTVAAGKGALFPVLAAGDWCYMVLRNASLVREVVKVEARTTDAFTIAAGGRGADGSTAYASWAANDVAEICLTNAALLDALADSGRWVAAGGSADAITANYTPDIYALVDGQLCFVRAGAANATATPTFSPDGLTARTIVQYGGAALEIGSIRGSGHELALRYNMANTRWELLNPEIGFAHATTKATPVDADAFGFWDSVSGALRKLTLANLKSIFALVAGSAAQAFAASGVTVSGAAPAITYDETDVGTDLKKWLVHVDGSVYRVLTLTDAGAGILQALNLDRSGNLTVAGSFIGTASLDVVSTGTTQAVGTANTTIATTAFCNTGFVKNDVGPDTVGLMTVLYNNAGGSIASNGTTAGANLKGTVSLGSDGSWSVGTSMLGTWRNVSGATTNNGYVSTWQRIS